MQRPLMMVVSLLLAGVAASAVCQTQASQDQTLLESQKRFTALDANGDGLLSKYEYDSDVVLTAADSNQDGLVSPQELEQALGPQAPGTKPMARRMIAADLDLDGQLNEDELSRAMEMRFKWLDKNADGNLDLEEMRAGFGVRVRP